MADMKRALKLAQELVSCLEGYEEEGEETASAAPEDDGEEGSEMAMKRMKMKLSKYKTPA